MKNYFCTPCTDNKKECDDCSESKKLKKKRDQRVNAISELDEDNTMEEDDGLELD